MISQFTTSYTPQHNNISEQRKRTSLDMVRSMISYSLLLTLFWKYAIQTAIYILNNVPSKFGPKTLQQLWTSHKLTYVISVSEDILLM